MYKKRISGVLMPLSCINGDFGVGVMGREAVAFLEKLKRMGFSCWQVLPIGMTDQMNSPYCSCSAFAGNPVYIDPRELPKGLLTETEIADNAYHGSCYTADYAYALEKRMKSLRIAFERADEKLLEKVKKFISENKYCRDFALYMALKEKHDLAPWWEWGDEYKDYATAVKSVDSETEKEALFQSFVQYIFYSQWGTLKASAESMGIKTVGDMPIYVSLDSADVWAHTQLFKLDEKTLKPKKVAGVPPDYFSADGQLWGNPIYDWDKMEKDGFKWWVERIEFALKIYDTVRIDHFRALASYWEVDADAKTAKNGEWKQGPGMKLFDKVSEKLKDPSIVAEDLGTFGEDVVKLLEDTGFPGMRVIQFGFDPNGDSTHLPHNYDRNCVAYVGTHDNNTLLGWLYEASPDERKFALDYCGYKGNNWGDGGYHSESCRSIVETVWKSSAYLAIISFQDMCGFGSDARMNRPGVAEGNWLYRAGKDAVDSVDEEYYKHINRLYRRS